LLLLAPFSFVFAVPALTWALLCLGYGLLLGVRLRDLCSAAAGVAAIAMQAGWSFGFFEELKTRLSRTGGARPMNGTTTHKTPTQDRIAR
jgi:succinoglycan biosynthesis protein ExoA